MGDLYDQLREQETDELQAELNRVTDLLLERDKEIARLKARGIEDLRYECAKLRAALERLASPEAFHMARTTNEEDRTRMRFAEAALENDSERTD